MKQQTFDTLLQSYENALVANGIGYSSRYDALVHANQIVKKHEGDGLTWLDENSVVNHLESIAERYYSGEMGSRRYQKRMRHLARFLHFCETGEIDFTCTHMGSRYTLTPEFERIASAFLASGDFHLNTRNDMRWVVHKYFAWLADKGHEDMTAVDVGLLQGFLLECTKKHPPNSMHNIKLYLKKLHAYLFNDGISPSAYTELLSFRVNRETKIYPALPMSDVAKLLDSIDRKSKSGKRNYAIMILGAQLGLRACDIVNMKFGDIDWVAGEIKISQSKTGKTVVLPLTVGVGEALRDYILNARPQSAEKHLFLRYKKPHSPLRAAVTIGEIYSYCCKDAGLPVSKSFHTLRRSLATAMVTNGVEVTTVAQVLGDGQVNSTKKYISLNSSHLKCCALPFDGISPFTVGGDEQ